MKKIIFFLLGLITYFQVSSQALVPPTPYCFPLYSQSPCNNNGPSNAPGNWSNDFINSFSTAGANTNISNLNSGCNAQTFPNIGSRNYFFFGCQYIMQASPGQVITATFQSGNTYSQGFALFIDYNQDGVFNTTNERVCASPGVPAAASFNSYIFTIPAAQANGTYRMRARCMYATPGTAFDGCQLGSWGEAEDYNIYIGIIPPNLLTATLTSNSPVCTGQNLILNTAVSNTAASTYTYTWGGPLNYTSNIQNPVIAANNPLQSGVYTVTINPGSCPITKTISLVVNATPTITSISNTGPVCQGNSVNINLTSTTSGTTTYSWVGPNSYTSNIQSPIIASANPSNTGVYSILVTNTFTGNASCTSTANTSFIVVPVNPITLVPSYTLCQGSNLNLNPIVTGASSFTWSGPNSFSSTLQSPTLNNLNPLNSGNYNVTAYFSAPNTTLICNSTSVTNLSIVPKNPVVAFATPNVCQNGVASFSAIAVGAAGYSWTGPNGFTSLNQINILNNVQPISSGNYLVNAIFSIGTVSCTTSSFIPINVIPMSTISVIPNISICEGNNVQLTANAPSALSYTWTGPNNLNIISPNISFVNSNPIVSGIYTVTASFSNGNITCYSTNQTDLLVKPLLNFTLSPVNKLCYGDNVNILGPTGATSYSWTGPNYNVNSQNLSITGANNSNVGIYNLVVDLNGCKTQSSIKIDVNDPIVWKYVPQNQTICKGDIVNILAAADLGSGNYAYNWNPSFGLSAPTGSTQILQSTGTTVYNVSVYDIACPNYVIQSSFIINVNTAPQPKLNLTKNKSCEPFCEIFNSHILNETTSIAYEFNGGNINYGDSINICLNAGIYSLNMYVEGKNGCRETINYKNFITVYPKPETNFTWNVSSPNDLTENKVTFFPSMKNGKPLSYDWYFTTPSQINSTLNYPTIIFDTTGTFPIYLISVNEFGCTDTIHKSIKIEDEISVFIPNTFTPNGDGRNDVFMIKGNGIKAERFSMEIFDRWGELIYSSNDINKGWDGTFKGTPVQDGTYVYSIQAQFTDNKGKKDFKGHVTLLK